MKKPTFPVLSVLVSAGLLLWTCSCGKKAETPAAPEAEAAPAAEPAEAAPAASEGGEQAAADDVAPERKANLAAVEAEFAKRSAQYKGQADMMVRPGLLANRAKREVEVAVEATGVAPNAIVEFLLIGTGSGHDYESLFVSFATARDIDEALKFIGMKPGRNAYSKPMEFWPRGERVMASLRLGDGTERPLESMVLDKTAEKKAGPTLPVAGFVYCGSFESKLNPGEFAADVDGPCSILSTYNEPTTVLDVPRKASQNEVYERFLANPDESMAKYALMSVVLRPEARTPAQGPRVVDCELVFKPQGDGQSLSVRLPGPDGAVREMPLAEMLQAPDSSPAAHDVHTTLEWDDAVTCGAAARLAKMVADMDVDGGLWIGAPKPGQLYYRAFLPQDAWRERKERPTQPLELRFARGADGALSATLVSIQEKWPEDGGLTPELIATEAPAPTADGFAAQVAAAANEIAALLVFAPEDATLGDIMPYIRAVQESKPNVYVFVE